MPDFEIAVIFSGMERKLAGSAYNMRVDECKAASYALKGFAHLEYGNTAGVLVEQVLHGSSLAIINPTKKDEIARRITDEYLKYFPNLKNSFGICFCKTSDGIQV